MSCCNDSIETITNIVLALITLCALVWTIISSRRSIKVAEDALAVADNTRKDDALPVLERLGKAEKTGHDFFAMTLHNIGKGKLYNFDVSVKPGDMLVSHWKDWVEPYGIVYYIQIDFQREPGNKHYKLTYTYSDRFGRKFKADHHFRALDKTIDISYDVDPPKEITDLTM